MRTLSDLIDTTGVNVLSHLDRQVQVPIVAGPQRQGDVLVIPQKPGKVAGANPVPTAGVPVVRGEAGGNTHLLLADGDVTWAPRTTGQTIGIVTVAEGASAYLAHPEHGYQGIAPGQYQVRRQREQADEIRMVAD